MVFTKGLHLARQSLAKTLTHGYAQSIVAGAQSSYATQSTSFGSFGSNFVGRLGKPGVNHSNHNAFHQSSQQSVTDPQASHSNAHGGDLAAYYTAWQKHQQRAEDKEWHQFQFAKRIAWKAPTTVPDGKGNSKEQIQIEDSAQTRTSRGSLERAYSTSVIDDIKTVVEHEGLEVKAITQANEIIAEEIGQVNEEAEIARSSANASPSARSHYSASVQESTSPLGASSTTSVSEADVYTAHLVKLANRQQYGEIPALFQSMLVAGVTPTSTAYNTLLAAAIHLPKSRHHVVPKALDVYSDMLRRRVLPDTVTYTTLIELMSNRALDVLSSKRGLEEKRLRYGGPQGSFLFPSQQSEARILGEDDSMQLAVEVFDASTSTGISRMFTADTYALLVKACAEHGRVPDMVRIYTQMESVDVVPSASMFPPMIKAFAACGDLRSSVECFDEYKALAITNDNGQISMDRNDDSVYTALIKAYAMCGRLSGGLKFLGKIEAAAPAELSRIASLRETAAVESILPFKLERGLYDEILDDPEMDTEHALQVLCIHAADAGHGEQAARAFDRLRDTQSLSSAASAMLACYIRQGRADAASRYWEVLTTAISKEVDIIEPMVMRTIALIDGPRAETAAQDLRQLFARVREESVQPIDVAEQIDEAIATVGHHLIKQGSFLPAKAAVEVMRSMVENGGLVPAVAAHMLATIGPESIAQFFWDDLMVVIQVQVGMMTNGSNFDIASAARLSHLLEVAMARGIPIDDRTSTLVESSLGKIDSPELALRWQNYRYPGTSSVSSPVQLARVHHQAYDNTSDPYASTTDFKGSSVIAEELDRANGRHANHLNEALTKLRNIRRSGRHPRYLTYAKLITAAAKENRINLAHDLLALARQDMPYLPQYGVVRHGWISLLDAMVGACLTVGKRDLAARYHQDLLDMGAAPTANTFGLYITTLKESTKTFDEASEAVDIFLRAKSEGVEPSSFLYNALIGKLGKARRIDDCLLYFAEMRNLGIKPTSVTYGTIVNALCRVSDDKFAEELFEEMESMPNYKPRPAPYNSLMQYFLNTKRDRSKVLAYWERMSSKGIQPTMHTYKLLIDTHATLEPVDMPAAEAVLEEIKYSGIGRPEAVHYAALIHAKGCVLHDMPGARAIFDTVLSAKEVRPQPCLYQALFESMVANHAVADTEALVPSMRENAVEMTPYIANTLIHGWANAGELKKAKRIFGQLGMERREPSTYEAMIKACLSGDDREGARAVVAEACSRGYPAAVAGKIADLVRT